jgi:hypothetical protein
MVIVGRLLRPSVSYPFAFALRLDALPGMQR